VQMQMKLNMAKVDDSWRSWISENLLLGGNPATLHATMMQAGIPRLEAEREIRAAIASPYLRPIARMRARLAKRDWLLETLSRLTRMHPDATKVERRERISRDEFLRDYYSQNRAVIITGMLGEWPAMQKWSLDYFADTLGEREVEVQFGRDGDPDYEVNQPKHKRTMAFGQYVETVRSAGVTNNFYMTANNSGHNKKAIQELWGDITQLPEYLDGSDPMAGYFWLGPAGTLTPFHHDLTNNFMAQVIGRKRVLLIPAHQLPLTYNHLHCYTPVDGNAIDYERFPLLKDATIQEVILHPGELLFLPIGHWHFVEALDVSCTMSFTNFVFDNDFSSNYRTYSEV